MTLSRVTVSLWVTRRKSRLFRGEVAEIDASGGTSQLPERGAFLARKPSESPSWSTRQVQRVPASSFVDYAIEHGAESQRIAPADRAGLHEVSARFPESLICLRDKLNPRGFYFIQLARARAHTRARLSQSVHFYDITVYWFDNFHDVVRAQIYILSFNLVIFHDIQWLVFIMKRFVHFYAQFKGTFI